MPEDDTNVLCHQTSRVSQAASYHSVNLPILKYIKEIEHLHQNLIKVRTPDEVKTNKPSVRCRLVIVPKGHRKKKHNQDELPFDTILVSRPLIDNCSKPIADKCRAPDELEKSSRESVPAEGQRTDDDVTTVEEKLQVNDPEEEIPAEGPVAKKHINPCICDLTKAQRKRIEDHLRARAEEQGKFQARLQQIEHQIRLLEEEAEQRDLACELEQELWGDESTCVPKRRRAFARRVSMVSLGIKQIINWKKPPKIKVKYNKVFELRKANTKYCKGSISEGDEPKEILISEFVEFPLTKTSQLRKQFNDKWIEEYNKQQEVKGKYPNRPDFTINNSKLWPRD